MSCVLRGTSGLRRICVHWEKFLAFENFVSLEEFMSLEEYVGLRVTYGLREIGNLRLIFSLQQICNEFVSCEKFLRDLRNFLGTFGVEEEEFEGCRRGDVTMSGDRRVRLVEGDTLWGLGERFNLPWEHIQSFNKLPDDVVYAGEELKLPSQRAKAFIVEPGDCAWEISVRFGLTLDELRDVNGGIPEVLYPGDVLFVPADAVLRPRQLWNLRAVKARLKGIAVHANAKFFDVFPYPQVCKTYEEGKLCWEVVENDFVTGRIYCLVEGIAAHANVKFFDVFLYPQDIDNYREKHRLLLNALRHVESSFLMPAPIGDGGLSIGPLQISTEYHQDAWWQASNTVKYEDCEGVDYSERTAINYWLRYCPWALEFGDWETLARTHNGGPCFWHSFATTRYWRRVKNALRSRGYIQGMPEFSSFASSNASIELFSTHIPFPVPMLESKVKESNLSKSSSQLQITSAVMEAATVGVHG